MVFTRFIEVGRVVLINAGPHEGKLATIIDVIDMARVLVDGPTTGVPRCAISYKNINLTDFKIELTPSSRTGRVQKAFTEAGIVEKWEATAWAKKLARRAKRASLTDFERFVVHVTKQKRNRAINSAYKKLKAAKK